jgi:hypothetical protein
MIATKTRRLTPAFLAVPILAVTLAACGTTTVDPKSGEDLIRTDINKLGKTSVKSVSCPSGIAPTAGTSFDCKVVLTEKATGKEHTGTITVHIVTGNKVEIYGDQDVHVT